MRCSKCQPCYSCGGPSEGWENGWRLRFCTACSHKFKDCNGDPIDFSEDIDDDHDYECQNMKIIESVQKV